MESVESELTGSAPAGAVLPVANTNTAATPVAARGRRRMVLTLARSVSSGSGRQRWYGRLIWG
ncbi:hypothetical protein GCM10010452_10150 [Crossiella cryophila]